MKRMFTLTKSKYRDGITCPKLLWYKINEPNNPLLIPDEYSQIRMDGGNKVGELARKLYPDGILIERVPKDAEATYKKTLEAMKQRKPLFEAGFIYKNAYALADIMLPVGTDEWDLLEVKAKNSIDGKDPCVIGDNVNINCADVAFQKYTYLGAKVNIRNANILHLNEKYKYDGKKIDIKKLFITADKYKDPDYKFNVQKEINGHLPQVENNMKEIEKYVSGNKPPQVPFNRNCKDCAMNSECTKILPEGNVLYLRGDPKGIRFQMLKEGITRLADIPITSAITGYKIDQINAHKAGKALIKTKLIKEFIDGLNFPKQPLYFLDFETMDPAIPIFSGTHSYQKVPFQYSLHVLRKKGGQLEHYSFLAEGDEDPRIKMLPLLKKQLGKEGAIITYNAKFERGRLKEAAEDFPEYNDWFYENINDRIADLEDPFSKFYYYDPKQNGSTSIKAVLPLLTKTSYDDLTIGEGGKAATEYMRVTFGDADEKDRASVRKNLEIYCKQDTMAMVKILEKLRKICKDN